MASDTDNLIAQLTGNLEPVRPVSPARGLVPVALAVALSMAGFWAYAGLTRIEHPGLITPIFAIVTGLLMVAGLSSTVAVVRMALPRVGNRHEGARWALIALSVVPFGAVLVILAVGSWASVTGDSSGPHCFMLAMFASLLTAAALVLALRRGAPVSLGAAGFYAGIAAGALGSFAYSLACPVDEIAHIGLWHMAPVALSALLGRALVPVLIRW